VKRQEELYCTVLRTLIKVIYVRWNMEEKESCNEIMTVIMLHVSVTSLYLVSRKQDKLIIKRQLINSLEAVVANNCGCLMNWSTGVRSQVEAKRFSSSLCVQTGSEIHPSFFYPVGTDDRFPAGKGRQWREADRSPHLVRKSKMSRT
jgi:hypothetical protein